MRQLNVGSEAALASDVVGRGLPIDDEHRSEPFTILFLLCFHPGRKWRSLLVYKYLLSTHYILGPEGALRL